MRLPVILFALGLGFAPLTQAADLVNAEKIETLTAALESLGYATSVSLDSQGDPKIASSVGGQPFSILMYRCKNGAGCQYILLQAHWTKGDYTAQQADTWNDIGIYGAVNVTDAGNPVLGIMIDLAGGGVPMANFKSQMDRWATSVKRFGDEMAKN